METYDNENLLIQAQNLQKHYPGFDLNIDLNLPGDRITGLVGLNGAGKSTLFKLLLNVNRADGGDAKIFGKPVQELTIADKAKIGVVMADSFMNMNLNVANLAKIFSRFYPDFDADFFYQQLANIPKKKPLKDLSTGMLARVKVISAIAHQPDLLILDEPTSGLDLLARQDILDLLRRFMEVPGRSILISSHISSDLENLCDDIYVLNQGHFVLHEDMDTVRDNFGILKLSESQYHNLDLAAVLKSREDLHRHGYEVLVSDRRYYQENYPDYVLDFGNIDQVLELLLRTDTQDRKVSESGIRSSIRKQDQEV